MGVTGRGRHFPGLGIDSRERHEKYAASGDRAPLLELRRDGDVLGRDRAVGRALHVDVASPVGVEVRDIDLEFLRRRLHHHRARLARRRRDRVADAVGAARGEAAHAMRAGVGIGRVDIDVLDRHAERLGADLPRHRLHALAEIDRGQGDGELAARIGMDQRLARVAAEIHADWIVDRGHAPSAKLRHVSASCRRPRKIASPHASRRPPADGRREAAARNGSGGGRATGRS